jgi:hypothetical protein
MEQDLLAFADKYSVSRVKFSTVNFDLDYERDDDGALRLKTEKAVIRTLGKVTKVPIGEGEEFSTYEEAEEATKKRWQEYYKKVRAKRSEKEKRAEALRQKRYRERRKAAAHEFDIRQ